MGGEHTPGPWRVDGDHLVTDNPGERDMEREVIADLRYFTIPRLEANARLIAAAPDLLEVCEALNVLRTHFDEATSGNQADAYYTFVKGEDALWAKLRAALAKAEGV